jgi:hypothetical protein
MTREGAGTRAGAALVRTTERGLSTYHLSRKNHIGARLMSCHYRPVLRICFMQELAHREVPLQVSLRPDRRIIDCRP